MEFGGQTQEEAEDAARRALAALVRPGRRWPKTEVVTDEEEQTHLWKIRESGLGATAFVPGMPDSWPGWEDSAVHPDRVGPYLRAMRELYARYDYQTSLYGHLGQGCVHCRMPFDLRTTAGIEKYRRFTREAAELVVSFGGSISGEHGDGQARGELLPIMFGHELVEAFRELKRIWDPAWKMNPGKVVDARPRTADLRLGPEYPRWEPDVRLALSMDEGELSHAAMRCVGIGECRREGGGTMCPSYMVTLEEKHSTRGRSRMLFELMRGEELSDGWKSEEVKDALDLCLSCKGCKSDCPVNVDMALYKAEFLYHHYQEKRRPRHAYAFGLIDKWARLGTRMPGLVNWAASAPILGALAKKTAGVAPEREIPKFAKVSFRQWFDGREHANADSPRRVLLWPDTFNNYFFPRTLAAAVEVLESAGVDVAIPTKVLCCGRPLYDYGMLDRAERYWREILETLRTEIIAGTTIVGVEPSCVAAFRDELLQMMPNDPLAKQLSKQTKTLGEYLDSLDDWEPPKLEGKAVYHGHCHHKAVMGVEHEHHLLHRMGLALETPATGCCGMAGAFGFEREHYEVSVACGERVLLPKVRELGDDAIVIADGFSCREQIEQLTDRQALHVAEVMQLAMHRHELAAARDRRPEAQVQGDVPPELVPAGVTPGRAAIAIVSAAAIGSAAWWWLAPLLGQ